MNDRLFEALANERRRQILFSLKDGPATISIDSPPDGIDERKAVILEQRHTHLPKLADYGFIRWVPGTNTVEKGSRFKEIKPILDLFDEYRE
ncbi:MULTISPECIES: DUF7344 domain-containing protein [Natrialbaceae]|uniref:DUF7344 domain-containing protein n=1 Tax=Natrialbaceae TaxID=1644061 RepID=UPI00207C9202|nr:hypothetical protein [Natronococcus sp. CG52]